MAPNIVWEADVRTGVDAICPKGILMPRVHRDLATSLCIGGMATARSLVNKVVFPTFQKVGYQFPSSGAV